MDTKKKAVKKTSVSKKPKKVRTKKQKIIRGITIGACVVLGLVLVCVLGGYLIIQHYYSLTNYQKDEDITTLAAEEISSILADDDEDDVYYINKDVTDEAGSVIGTEYQEIDIKNLTPEEQSSLDEIAQEQYSIAAVEQSQVQAINVASSSNVYNILLIGVDLRAGSNWNGNSDSMILVSIDSSRKIIFMTSFMRDTYVNIPTVGGYKLNRAHAVGGGPLLCQTIEQNFRIAVDAYATVDFYDMIAIIDAVGGVNLTVTAAEADVANKYLHEICRGNGTNVNDYLITPGENIHLNGAQAVAYCRIRYVGSDYARTQRQRTVLTLIFQKLQTMNLSEVNNFLNVSLPLVTHNIPASSLTALITNVPTYLTYSIYQSRVPFDGHFTSQNENLVPDYTYTIQTLQNLIYGI